MLVEFSSLNITSDNIVEIIKAVLFTVADIVLVFFAVENGDGSKNENKAVGMMKGVISFVLLCGINVGKNVFMFGSDFLSGLENPDLAAIRLIPMFELPHRNQTVPHNLRQSPTIHQLPVSNVPFLLLRKRIPQGSRPVRNSFVERHGRWNR